MAISYPISIPAARAPSRVDIRARSTVGLSASPFTGSQQTYVHPGEVWEMDITLPPLVQSDAEKWVGFLLSLNGREGTFLMGDAAARRQGNWAGSPVVSGSVVAGVKSIPMRGFSSGATVKVGDWLQMWSGASTHLHKVSQDATADSGGLLTLEIWPRTRGTLADGSGFVTSNAKGIWRLASNVSQWSIAASQIYGIQFQAVEAL